MLYFKRNQGQVAFNPVFPELSIQLLPFKHPGLWVLFLKYMKESNITSSAMTCLHKYFIMVSLTSTEVVNALKKVKPDIKQHIRRKKNSYNTMSVIIMGRP